MSDILKRLAEYQIELPQAAVPVANYSPTQTTGNTLVISGQLPMENGAVKYTGKVGDNTDVESAVKAAELCAINVLSQMRTVCGDDFSNFSKLVRIGVFVNASQDFEQHAVVANGASDLLANILGEAGIHARAAVGCSSLPLGATVEVEALVELKG